LKVWAANKYVKASDWRVILAKLDELKSAGVVARVRVLGHIVDKKKLNRNRRRVEAESGKPMITFLECKYPLHQIEWKSLYSLLPGRESARCRHITLERQTHDCAWVPYTGEEHTIRGDVASSVQHQKPQHEIAPIQSPTSDFDFSRSTLPQREEILAINTLDQTLPRISTPSPFSTPMRLCGLSSPPEPFMDSCYTMYDDGQLAALPPSDASFDCFADTISIMPGMVMSPSTHLYLPLNSGMGLDGGGQLLPSPQQVTGAVAGERQDPLGTLVRLMLNNSSLPQRYMSRVDDLLRDVRSLFSYSSLRLNISGDEVAITGDSLDSSRLLSALLCSIANGFIGFHGIPQPLVLAMAKKHLRLSPQLSNYLQTWPKTAAIQLARNLFRAAVESCDVSILTTIIEAMESRGEMFDPDSIVCEVEGTEYTPLEVAAGLRNFEGVQVLLRLKLDAKKTYQSANFSSGPLGTAIFGLRFGDRKAALAGMDAKIIRILLESDAEASPQLIHYVLLESRDVSTFGNLQQVVGELLKWLPNGHRDCFEPTIRLGRGLDGRASLGSLVPFIAAHCENEFAVTIIQRLVEECGFLHCSICPRKYFPDALDHALIEAARRDNQRLCKFLLGLIKASPEALSAAISAGGGGPTSTANLFLIQLQGTSNQPLVAGEHSGAWKSSLSEAIRRKDRALAQRLESLGAWTAGKTPDDDFGEVLVASAEAGDLEYIARIFKEYSTSRSCLAAQSIRSALTAAIKSGHTEAAFAIIDAGPDFRPIVKHKRTVRPPYWCLPHHWDSSGPLAAAIEQQNLNLVGSLLELDLDLTGSDGDHAINTAANLGNVSLVRELLDKGCMVGTESLMTAVVGGNRELVGLLLGHGGDPNGSLYIDGYGITPLCKAFISRDRDMVEFLLSAGGDPADARAFIFIIKEDVGALDLLLEAFRRRYPNGCRGFGAESLIAAVEHNSAILGQLLDAGMDVNAISMESITPLVFAVRHNGGGNIKLVQTLLDAGADANTIGEWPTSHRLGAATGLHAAIETQNCDMVTLLLDSHADINQLARRSLKRTPLQLACEVGSFAVVELLLNRGANANSPPALCAGGTALQFAAISGNPRIVSLLLHHGADLHAAPSKFHGRTALQGAAEHGRIAVLELLWHTANGNFDAAEVERGQELARKRGNTGCADRLTELLVASHRSPALSPSLILENPMWWG